MSDKQVSRFNRALRRNTNDVVRAIFYRRALEGMEAANTSHSIDFFRLSYWALFNDYIRHAIRLFEKGGKNGVTSFWYIFRCAEPEINKIAADNTIDIDGFDTLSEQLKLVRNRTHFHIDRKAVFDPRAVWHEANIRGEILSKALDDVFIILNELYVRHIGEEFHMPEYDGSDATKILKIARSEGLIP